MVRPTRTLARRLAPAAASLGLFLAAPPPAAAQDAPGGPVRLRASHGTAVAGGVAAILLGILGASWRGRAGRGEPGRIAMALAENVTSCLVLLDGEGRVAYMNPAAEAVTGWTFDEIRGQVLHDVVHHARPDGRPFPISECPIGRNFQARRGFREHADVFIRKDGTFFPVVCSIAPMDGSDGAPNAVLEFRDVTEARRHERALAESEERSRSILENMSDAFVALDSGWRLAQVNETAARLFRRTREELLGRVFWEVFPHLDGPAFGECARRAAGRREPARFELYEPVLGRWLECRCDPAPEGLSVFFTDTTERKRSMEDLRRSRERLDAALAASGVGLFRWDIATDALEFDANLNRLFGIGPGQSVSRLDDFVAKVHPDDREAVASALERSRALGVDFDLEYRVIRPGGEVRWVLDRGKMSFDEVGRPASMTGGCVDVTAQKRAEEGLRHQNAVVRTITDNAASGLFLTDERGRPTFMNPAAEAVTGFALDELSGRPLHESIHARGPDGRPIPADDCPVCRTPPLPGPIRDHRDAFTRKDGTPFPVACSVAPIERDGRPAGAVLEFRDITEQERAERELLDAMHRAETASRAKDQFLAMLSHELRTPLTPVLLDATARLASPETPPELRATFEMIRQNIQLEARLIDDLLDVMRIIRGKMPYQFQVVDAHDLLRRTVEICRAEVEEKGLALTVDLAAAERNLLADPARLQQVLWNLVKNAVKFTPTGGTIRVSSRNDGPGKLVVEVADDGVGIEPEALSRIFNAFEQGEVSAVRQFGGLGLGLAIGRSIAEAHGGTLEAASAGQDRGTTMTLTLGTVSAAAEPAAPDGPAPARPRPETLRLLLVEDDPMTARIMAKLLRQNGYQVTVANNLALALKAPLEEFDLIVSDIGLPDGSGLDLIRHAKARRGIPGIALSGFGMDDDLRKSVEAGFDAHLTKPVDFAKLDETIQRVAAGG